MRYEYDSLKRIKLVSKKLSRHTIKVKYIRAKIKMNKYLRVRMVK